MMITANVQMGVGIGKHAILTGWQNPPSENTHQ